MLHHAPETASCKCTLPCILPLCSGFNEAENAHRDTFACSPIHWVRFTTLAFSPDTAHRFDGFLIGWIRLHSRKRHVWRQSLFRNQSRSASRTVPLQDRLQGYKRVLVSFRALYAKASELSVAPPAAQATAAAAATALALPTFAYTPPVAPAIIALLATTIPKAAEATYLLFAVQVHRTLAPRTQLLANPLCPAAGVPQFPPSQHSLRLFQRVLYPRQNTTPDNASRSPILSSTRRHPLSLLEIILSPSTRFVQMHVLHRL